MGNPRTTPDLKAKVRGFWNSDPCGTRYLKGPDTFATHARVRYELEPHIARFAEFEKSHGLRILEIGVGMGADYLEWLKAGAVATGIDLSLRSLEQARGRCLQAGYSPDLYLADAERLPFQEATFDLVYSYGVMHHSPDTEQCLREAWRVLKPGGQIRIMVYHHPSLTGIMLWLRYGALRGVSIRQVVAENLESPGTKSFTRREVLSMMSSFERVKMQQVFSPGDLLLNQPSRRFEARPYRLAWKVFPRTLAKKLCRKLGLFLLISGRKPSVAGVKNSS